MEPTAAHDVFTEPWVAAWAHEIRASDAYRQAAVSWEGSLALEMTTPEVGGSEPRGVVLDLWHGDCREARVAQDGDLEQADFVLTADQAIWRRVLERDLEPIFGLMTGKLKLRRGNLSGLMPFMTASKELVLAATRVPSTFPAPGTP